VPVAPITRRLAYAGRLSNRFVSLAVYPGHTRTVRHNLRLIRVETMVKRRSEARSLDPNETARLSLMWVALSRLVWLGAYLPDNTAASAAHLDLGPRPPPKTWPSGW
jgi:hypothetical protein